MPQIPFQSSSNSWIDCSALETCRPPAHCHFELWHSKARHSRVPRTAPFLRLGLVALLSTSPFILRAETNAILSAPADDAWPDRIHPVDDGSWPVEDPRLHGYQAQRLDAAIDQLGREEGVYGVLVVRSGALVAERYFREGTRTKGHNLKSSSKSILSALIGLAIEDGLVSLDHSVIDRLNVRDLPADRQAITVRDVLMMASGLESTSYQAYNEWIASSNWVRGALALPLLSEPGTEYRYSTGNTHLLSALVTAVTGRSTRDYAEERLFGPLGVEIAGWEKDPQGIYIGGNNLALIPRDMARFGQLYLQNGRWHGQQVVPERWVRESTSWKIDAPGEIYGDYGYHWFLPSAPAFLGDFVAVGFGGQYIYVSPRYDTVVVITSTLESKGVEWTQRVFRVLEDELLRAGGEVRISQRLEALGKATPAAQVSEPPETLVAEATSSERAQNVLKQNELETQVAGLRAQVQDLEQREASGLERISELTEMVALARQSNDRAKDVDRAVLEAQIADLMQKAGIQTIELERLRRDLGVAGEAQERLKERFESELEQAVASDHREQSERDGALRISLEETEEHRTAALGLRSELTDLRQQLAQATESAKKQSNEADRLRLELERSEAAQRRLVSQTETEIKQSREAAGKDRTLWEDSLRASFSAERAQLKKELATEQARADQALRELQKERQRIDETEPRLSAESLRADAALALAEQAERNLADRGARLASLQTELAETRSRLSSAELHAQRLAREAEQLSNARSELAQAETGRLEFQTRAATLEEQVTTLRAERDRVRDQQEQVVAAQADLSGSVAAARSELELERQATGRLKVQLEAAQMRSVELEQRAMSTEGASARVTELEAELETLAAAVSDAQRRDGTSRRRIAELERDVQRMAQLEQETASLSSDLATSRAKVTELQAFNDSLRSTTSSTESEHVLLLERLEERERSLRSLQAELRATQESANATTAEGKQLAQLRATYEGLLQETEMLARRSGEQSETVRNLERRLASAGSLGASPGVDRNRVKALLSELDQLLADRRATSILRQDLLRLRDGLVDLQRP